MKPGAIFFQFELEITNITTLRRPIVVRRVVQQHQKVIGVKDAYAGRNYKIDRKA